MVVYSGMVTSTSTASVGAYVVVKAVADPTSADSTTSIGRPKLDLAIAGTKLKSEQGVYFDSTKVESALASKYVASDTNLVTLSGGDKHTVKLGNLNYELTKFTNANITAGNGNNVITVAATENGNQFNLGSGNNTISLDGKNNNLFLGAGNNFVQVTGGTGTNYIIDGGGPTALTINSANGFTQVSKWDLTQDTLHFGSNISLSDVKVRLMTQDWSYDVYVKDKLVANLITVGGLSLADPTTKLVYQSNLSPTGIHAQTNAGFLSGLYADALNRAPDSAGLASWSNALSKGAARTDVAKAFFTAAEFEANYKNSGEYVSALYKGLLGRSADGSGLANYTKAIDAGTSHGAVIDSMLASSEFVKVTGVSHPVVGVTVGV
jgi:hypothetical protein